MGKKYERGKLGFQDYFVNLLMNDFDISNKEIKEEIYSIFKESLLYTLYDENHINYLDFDIKKKDIEYTIIPNNIITALWLTGIIPTDNDKVMNDNYFHYKNIKYIFNKKEKKLKKKKINE